MKYVSWVAPHIIHFGNKSMHFLKCDYWLYFTFNNIYVFVQYKIVLITTKSSLCYCFYQHYLTWALNIESKAVWGGRTKSCLFIKHWCKTKRVLARWMKASVSHSRGVSRKWALTSCISRNTGRPSSGDVCSRFCVRGCAPGLIYDSSVSNKSSLRLNTHTHTSAHTLSHNTQRDVGERGLYICTYETRTCH